MAPKKKKDHTKLLIGVYDVELMTDEELKDYIGVLIEEKERIKLLLIQLERDKCEVTNFLENTDREILNRIESSIQKDFDLQKKLNESFHNMKQNERENLLAERELEIKDAKCNFEAFKRIQLTITQQSEENQCQQKLVQNVIRENERNNIDDKFVTFSGREKEEEQIVLKEKDLNEVQIIAENCIQKFHDTIHDFYKEKVNKVIDIFESSVKEDTVEHSFSTYAEELSIYFQEILCKNLETTTTLKKEVEKLENELNKLQHQRRDAKLENKQLKLNKPFRNSLLDSGIQKERVNDQVKEGIANKDEAKLNKLVYENDVLNEKLRNISKERDALKNHFVSAKRRIYQKADFKTYLLEQMLLALRSKSIFPEASTRYAILPKRKYHKDRTLTKDSAKTQLKIKGNLID